MGLTNQYHHKSILNQAAVGNFEYNPIIHDLSLEPRALSAEEAVDTWLDMWESDADTFGQYSLQKLMHSTSSREHFHFPPNSYGGSPIHQVQQQTSFRVASDNKEHEPSFCPKKLWGNHWVSFVLNLSDLPFFLQLCSNPFARPWNCGPGSKINFSSYAFTSRSTHAKLYRWKNSSCTQMHIDYNIVHPCSQMPSDINKRYSICFSNKGGGAHIGPVISAHRGKRVPNSSLSARNQVSGNGQGKTFFHGRNATSGHYLGLNDRLQLGTDLLASCAKLLYAFLWQVEITLIMILLWTSGGCDWPWRSKSFTRGKRSWSSVPASPQPVSCQSGLFHLLNFVLIGFFSSFDCCVWGLPTTRPAGVST